MPKTMQSSKVDTSGVSRRGRPAKKKIEQINASPDDIARALVRAADHKGKERRKAVV